LAYTCLYNVLSTEYGYQKIVGSNLCSYTRIVTEEIVNESLCDIQETVNFMCITIMCLVNTYYSKNEIFEDY